MIDSHGFLSQVLDSITEHIVVIDGQGEIKFVNKSWIVFGNANACLIRDDWQGVNYLEECDKAARMQDDFGGVAAAGIRRVIAGEQDSYYFEYPCHSPTEHRWFMMRVTAFQESAVEYYVISHQNITERKLAEERVHNLARVDGLTNIPNRRAFDEFLHEEWRRCIRLKKTLCLALVDLDHFKLLNDTYGHQAGDDCLSRVGEVMSEFANRPSDICARYGGEEFALIWGDTEFDHAMKMADRMLAEIIGLEIDNAKSPIHQHLTASIGLVEVSPRRGNSEFELIQSADDILYQAKKEGRNRVIGMKLS